MTRDPEEKEPAFKVVDRRRFTEASEENRAHVEPEKEEKKADIPLKPSPNSERPPLSFSLFIQSLAHQTMMALGIMPWPDSGLVRVELGLAKETIDILQILKDKTAGNLSTDEERLLEGLLYQLKMAFIEIAKKPPVDAGSIIT